MTPNTPLLQRSKEFQTLTSPSNAANSSARRRRDTALLHSPARRSHSACMRQIFDNKQQYAFQLPVPPDMSYPSLPNVSRPISSLRERLAMGSPTTRVQSRQPPPLSKDATEAPSAFEPQPRYILDHHSTPSESWSGDSGYLYADGSSVPTDAAAAASSVVRVSDWLSATFDNKSECTWDAVSEDIKQDFTPVRSHFITHSNSAHDREKLLTNDPRIDICQSRLSVLGQHWRSDKCTRPNSDDLETQEAEQRSNCTGTGIDSAPTPGDRIGPGGLGPSSLSPNVCTDRGPSRYHRDCKAHSTAETSPSKLTSFRRLQRQQFPENLAPDDTAFREDLVGVLPA